MRTVAEIEIGRRAKLTEIAGSHEPAITRLSEFLRLAERKLHLAQKDRLRIVDQALLVLEMTYVHLPLKRAMHAIDPIQQLKLLRFRLSEIRTSDLTSDWHFHREMLSIFGSARDLHTLYLLPEPYRDRVAYLPFLLEQYFETKHGRRVERFLISRVVADHVAKTGKPIQGPENFGVGVEVLYWNGVPIRRAIEINGQAQAGSNLEARFARGLDNITIRPLDSSLPPDEHWVDITYRSEDGRMSTRRQHWLVHHEADGKVPSIASKDSSKRRAALDLKKTRVNQFKRKLYAPSDIRRLGSIEGTAYAEIRKVNGRDYGYVRLFSFDVQDPDKFVDDFATLITRDDFPRNGLILDVRGNGGGRIRAGERLLQLLTPKRIQPETFEFINTPLTLEICRVAPKNWNLRRWVDSMREAVVTGATYSSGFPLNSEESCNDIGQVYYGPVVLITDALSYSTTDIFAAGFQDNAVGLVLGTSGNTGAGGANVWWYEDCVRAVGERPKSPFKPLPKGADMMVAVRRSIRVGPNTGRPLEELGITPDRRHFMTRHDILGNNSDLIAKAVDIIEEKPAFLLSVKPMFRGVVVNASSRVHSSDASEQISRLDLYVDGRPLTSIDARWRDLQSKRIPIHKSHKGPAQLLVEARDGHNNLVAMRRLVI